MQANYGWSPSSAPAICCFYVPAGFICNIVACLRCLWATAELQGSWLRGLSFQMGNFCFLPGSILHRKYFRYPCTRSVRFVTIFSIGHPCNCAALAAAHLARLALLGACCHAALSEGSGPCAPAAYDDLLHTCESSDNMDIDEPCASVPCDDLKTLSR